jgi:N-acetylglucosamine kinase-like BadF-type ATPase
VNLTIDLGQSGARFEINGSVTRLEIAKDAATSLQETVRKVCSEVPAGIYENVYLSLTGLQGDVKDPSPFGEICRELFGAKSVAVMDDGIAAYVGALGERNGIALTLGGGVVAIAARDGRFGHADGKGPIFGDFGGGYWIGREAMVRAIATIDGRDDANDLVELLANSISQYRQLENTTGVEAARLCIATAKVVADGAVNGVKSAEQILKVGAGHLARTVYAAWNKVKGDGSEIPNLALLGGLAQSEAYVHLIKNELQLLLPFTFVASSGDHLVGAPKAAELFPDGAGPLLKWCRY